MRNITFTLFLSFLLLMTGCGNRNKKNDDTIVEKDSIITEQQETGTLESDKKLQDIARFISGKEVQKGSELYEASQSIVWKGYAQKSESLWTQFRKKAEVYQNWATTELYPNTKEIKTLFYPFSGADFLYADIFFPNVKEIYLFGLENVGTVPTIDSLCGDSLSNYLYNLNRSIRDIFQVSFFLTNNMKEDLNNENIDGVAPLLLVFITQSGKEVLSMHYGSADSAGNFIEMEYADLPNYKNKMLKITYRQPEENNVRHLYYIGGTNVADFSLKNNPEFVAFLNQMEQGCATFIKSASYLMHKDYFSIVRNVILTKSAVVMQDDSGIPYRFFKPEEWKTSLYGSYTEPIPMFKSSYEQDLFDAYQNGNPKPMNFRMGYNRISNERIHIRLPR